MVIVLVLSAQVSIPLGITVVGTSYQRVEVEVHVPHVKMQFQMNYTCLKADVDLGRMKSDVMSCESRRIQVDDVVRGDP